MVKSNKKVTRLRLSVDQSDEFIILGIVSSEADYKLSLALNKKLKISLKSISPVKINDAMTGEILFSRFAYSSTSGLVYTLVSNRSDKTFLLRKLLNIDYVLHLYDPEQEIKSSVLSTRLREIDHVTAVFNVDKDLSTTGIFNI